MPRMRKVSLLELLKEARRTWNRKGKSLENILDPNPNRVKEGTERWSGFGFKN